MKARYALSRCPREKAGFKPCTLLDAQGEPVTKDGCYPVAHPEGRWFGTAYVREGKVEKLR